MNTIIEKIRTWVNQRKKALHSTLFNDEYNDFLSFLSDLEKEEKPSEGLEEEYKNYVESDPVYNSIVNGKLGLSLEPIARHFAQWGAEHFRDTTKMMETQKDLESYAQKVEDYYDVGEERGYLCVHRGEVKDAVIAGAKWQKEQLMKDAVEWDYTLEDGRIEFEGDPLPCLNPILNLPYPKFKPGQKVKIIVIKED